MNVLKRSIGVLLVFLLCTTAAFAGITKVPYLIYENTNAAMTVLWQDNATETNVIKWGTDTSYSLGSANVAEYGTSNQHKYAITGLQPDTKYYYQVISTAGGTVYGSGSFVTAPAATATAVKFLAFGDTRSTPSDMEKVVTKMRAEYASDPAYQGLVLQAGDWVSSDAESAWTAEWFNANPQTRALFAETPINGVKGNHEGTGTYYKKYYPYPYAANFYWSFDYGPVHFTVVDQDTNYTMGSANVAEYGSSHQHKYAITGLTPSTKYYYQVSATAGGTVYGTGSFVAAPAASATAVKFLAFGDTRSNPASMEQVINRMRAEYATDPAFQSLTLQVGDWVSSDAESAWTSEWFNANPQTRALLAETPINGVKGNHEGTGTYYAKYYPYPYTAGAYWSFDYGPLHVSVVDQYTGGGYTSGTAQYNWLVNDLATTTKPWKIILIHEPGWAAGTHANNTTVQNVIQPLVLQYGVDMVLTGHNHNYVRAMVNNIPHITDGGGGAPLYAVDMGQPNVVAGYSGLSYCSFDINGNTMTMKAKKTDGTVVDTITVTHGASVPAAPTGLTATAGNAQVNLSWNCLLRRNELQRKTQHRERRAVHDRGGGRDLDERHEHGPHERHDLLLRRDRRERQRRERQLQPGLGHADRACPTGCPHGPRRDRGQRTGQPFLDRVLRRNELQRQARHRERRTLHDRGHRRDRRDLCQHRPDQRYDLLLCRVRRERQR